MAFLDTTGLTHLVDKLKGIIGTATLTTTDKTVKGGINELHTKSEKMMLDNGRSKLLNNSTNIDTFEDSGVYFVADCQGTYPVGAGTRYGYFTQQLSYFGVTDRIQTYTPFNDKGMTFRRIHTGDAWKDWEKLIDSSDALTAEEISASTNLQPYQVAQASVIKTRPSSFVDRISAKSTKVIRTSTYTNQYLISVGGNISIVSNGYLFNVINFNPNITVALNQTDYRTITITNGFDSPLYIGVLSFDPFGSIDFVS